jgi:hypothetical protein
MEKKLECKKCGNLSTCIFCDGGVTWDEYQYLKIIEKSGNKIIIPVSDIALLFLAMITGGLFVLLFVL